MSAATINDFNCGTLDMNGNAIKKPNQSINLKHNVVNYLFIVALPVASELVEPKSPV